MRDFPATDVDQVPGSEHSDRLIVNANEIRRQARQVAIDQHIRGLLFFNSEEELDGGTTGCNDQGVQPACQQLINLLFFQVRIFVRGGNNQVVPAFSQSLGKSLGNFCKERMKEVWNHQSNQIRSAGYKAPRRQVWAVIKFLDTRENSLPGFVSYVRMIS